jgi:hypothetical protein
MEENIILVLGFVLGLIAYGLIAKWYVVQALDKHSREKAIVPLALLHCFRYQGLSFLQPGVVASDLPPAFAIPAAYGDLLTAILALISVVGLHNRWRIAIPLVWIFNIVGTLDLLNAIAQGLTRFHAGQLGGAYYIPTIIVPALLVTHFLIFRILLKRGEGQLQP